MSRTNRDGIPAAAIMAQAGLTLAFIVTASFETILVFAGFTLGLNSLLAVAGVFVLRVREPDAERPYRAWGFPFTPLAYLAVTLWTLLHIAVARPAEALTAIPLIGGGLVLHAIATRGRRAERG